MTGSGYEEKEVGYMQTPQGAFNEHRIKCDSLYTTLIENRENVYDESAV